VLVVDPIARSLLSMSCNTFANVRGTYTVGRSRTD